MRRPIDVDTGHRPDVVLARSDRSGRVALALAALILLAIAV